jgi:hypothetical protein
MFRRPWYRSHFLILLIIFLLQWLLLFSIREPTWDAVSYYAYARSVLFDQDLQFDNDFQLSYETAGEHFASKRYDQVLTSTGRVASPFAIGAPILWLPWFAVLRLVSGFIAYPLPDGSSLSGYERFFVSNIATWSALLGLLAYLPSYRVAQGVTNQSLALISTVTFMFVTPLLYYQFREPMYSHAASALMVALCIYVWWKQYEEIGTVWQGLGLGALIGLAGLVRWQNIAFLLLPLVSVVLLWFKQPAERRKETVKPALVYLLVIGAAAMAVFSLQLSVWKILYGGYITIPQGNAYISWRASFLIPLLFSSFRGLLPWMPVFFLAVIGLLALGRQRPLLGLPLLLVMALAIYIHGSTRDWFGGGGYGPRRLTSELAILVLGYAVFLRLIPHRFRLWVASLLSIGLVLHQWFLLRFGLPERLGGRVMSMYPTYNWEDVPLTQMAADMLNLVPRIGVQPSAFLVHPGSPLDSLLNQQSVPVQHIASLLSTTVFLLLMLAGGIYLGRRLRKTTNRVAMIVLIAVCLGLFNLWVLVGS